MGAITIRRLDDAVIARLKAKAKANGRSMEEEARAAVIAAAEPLGADDFVRRMRARHREVFGDRMVADTTETLRGLREEDPTGWNDR